MQTQEVNPYDILESLADEMAELKTSLPVPKETCPKINKVIEAINNIDRICTRMRRQAEYEWKDMIQYIEGELVGLTASLEELRQNNGDLRELGSSWYHFAKEQQEAYTNLIEDLFPLPVEDCFAHCTQCNTKIPKTGNATCLGCLAK